MDLKPERVELARSLGAHHAILGGSGALEAVQVASGLPIRNKSRGHPYTVKHEKNALLVDLDDDKTLADCACRLFEEPGLAQRLTGDGLIEVKRYDGDVVRTQRVALYRRLMATAP